MKLNYYTFELPFQYPFTISKGTKTHQPTLIIELEHFGIKGYGEAPAISYYNITVDKMIGDLETYKSDIEKFNFTEPERFWHFLHHLLHDNPFLVAALDIAGWDLFGKLNHKPIKNLILKKKKEEPLTDYTIGIDSIASMIEKMKAKPWPIYKVKVGTADDIAIVKALRAESNAKIRIDANAAWSLEQALNMIPEFEKLDIELIEQPLAKDDWEGMKSLKAQSAIPLFADESCVFESDVKKCADIFHGINIKLTKCSGISPALTMISEANQLGLKVMLGCMNESSVGSAAMAQLLPYVDYVDMDGPLLLTQDVATGLQYDFGKVSVNNQPGLGIEYTGLYDKVL